jgi:hypothetical protein
VVLAATSTAAAQSEGEGGEPVATPGAWAAYPNERHLVGRLTGGVGLSFNDAFGAGLLAPPWLMVDGGYLLKTFGSIRTGPRLGVQLGFDSHSAVQYAVQPGWMVLARSSSTLGFTGRLDVPVLITRGRNEYTNLDSAPGTPIQVLTTQPRTVSFGVEAGFGAAYYLTSGIALTGEISASLYFGDSFYTYPVLGLGIGALVDYELLP